MKTTKCALAALAALGLIALIAPSAVRADTVKVFNVTGTFEGGTPLTGTVTIDTTTGKFTAESLQAVVGFISISFTGIYVQGKECGQQTCNYEFLSSTAMVPPSFIFNFLLVTDVPSLIGYQGGPLCGQDGGLNCTMDNSVLSFSETRIFKGGLGSADILDGQLTLLATPEPSSLTLFGAGLMGLIGIAVRRKRLA